MLCSSLRRLRQLSNLFNVNLSKGSPFSKLFLSAALGAIAIPALSPGVSHGAVSSSILSGAIAQPALGSQLAQTLPKSCGHRLVSVEGGQISRQPAGQGGFSAVGGSVTLCANDILNVPQRVRVRVRCQGTSRDRRFFSGRNAVRRLCSQGGISISRGEVVELASLPYATHVASAKPKLLAYISVVSDPEDKGEATMLLEIINSETSEFVTEAFLDVPLKDLSYRDSPEATAAAGRPQGIYDGVVMINTAKLDDMPDLDSGVDYQWSLGKTLNDGEVTSSTTGIIHYRPFPEDFNPTQTVQASPTTSYRWLLDHDYGGEALALVARDRLRPLHAETALTQWSSLLERLDKGEESLEKRLRQAEVVALP
ncbi:MAG: hypothetical protein AAF685_11375 [Cyanobacteria bacterium P01_C01_bin.89]